MPSAQYYIDQARTLLSWARTTRNEACAKALRQRAGSLLDRSNSARSAVGDLNSVLANFNDGQMLEPHGQEGRDA